ncbi:hypothetical protein [Fimbriiglobus ruber]|uniref:DUF3352 domain-containing protein n=1 Tax=Fimbriiglobus ruber TaxID=1908690 RepID=A0A225DMJ2_9BACT|nr:hypothetical protein [Fimbriiglobus ruber]OWK38676.1 hypothetical protein FRUB_07796 [Fimbriiglobus ruber]
MTRPSIRGRLAAALVFALGVVPVARAADPAAEVLRLVPPDTAVCFVARDLRTHVKEIGQSPFVASLLESAVGKPFAQSPELQKLKGLEQFFVAQFGLTPQQLRDDIFGDAVVFAYRPGPADKPGDETGLVLIRAGKPDALDKLVGKLNDFQRATGEVKSAREKTHAGQTYTERVKSAGASEYYWLRDGILAYSAQEQAIRGVIEQAAASGAKEGRVAAAMTALGVNDKFAVCWFDPRAFDGELRAKTEAAKTDDERAVLAHIRTLWAAADGLALYAHPGRGLELGLVAAFDRTRVPAGVRDLLLQPRGTSALWGVVPPDALAAAGGRVNLPKMFDAIEAFQPAGRKTGPRAAIEQHFGPLIGRDKLPVVLTALGPDWIAWAAPPATKASDWVPESAFVLKLTAEGKSAADVAASVRQAIEFAAQVARVQHNKTHADQIDLAEEDQGGVVVKYLTGDQVFAPGVRPAYAIKDGYLIVATTPDVIRRFVAPKGAVAPAAPAPVVRVAAKQLREYIGRHGKTVAKTLAALGGKPVEETDRDLTNLFAALELFDKVELHHSADGGKIRFVVSIDFVKPLK